MVVTQNRIAGKRENASNGITNDAVSAVIVVEGLAMLGEENSTMTVFPFPTWRPPGMFLPFLYVRNTVYEILFDRKKLINPGPQLQLSSILCFLL